MFGEQLNYSAKEIRYTTNHGKLYAILFGARGGRRELKSLGTDVSPELMHISSVKLLGANGQLKWTRSGAALFVSLGQISERALSPV